MPNGEGFWIDPRGRAILIYDHLTAVLTEPVRYGLRPKDVEGRGRADRTEILKKVLGHGFIRVRRPKSQLPTYEFSTLSPGVRRRIVNHLAWFDAPMAIMSQVRPPRRWVTTLEALQL